MSKWVIVRGGRCIPACEATGNMDPSPVTVEWIEQSRQGWAKEAIRAAQQRYQAQQAIRDVLNKSHIWLPAIDDESLPARTLREMKEVLVKGGSII